MKCQWVTNKSDTVSAHWFSSSHSAGARGDPSRVSPLENHCTHCGVDAFPLHLHVLLLWLSGSLSGHTSVCIHVSPSSELPSPNTESHVKSKKWFGYIGGSFHAQKTIHPVGKYMDIVPHECKDTRPFREPLNIDNRLWMGDVCSWKTNTLIQQNEFELSISKTTKWYDLERRRLDHIHSLDVG